jgi:MSHA biogenesis protein MshL
MTKRQWQVLRTGAARILWICLLPACLIGCQAGTQHKTLNVAVMDEIHDVMTESAATASPQAYPDGPPMDVLEALVPGLSLASVDMEPEEERFDFAVREPLDVKEFFSLLFEGTNYSVIVHPGLDGSISALDLKNVTVSEAMQQLSAIYGFSIQRDGSIYRVEPGGLQTRIFKVDYLNVQRSGTSNMSVTGGTGLTGNGAGGMGGMGGLGGIGGIGGLGGGLGNNLGLLRPRCHHQGDDRDREFRS